MIVILTGVAGCGKSRVGHVLARCLGWRFIDADDYHPPENIAKMAQGQALDDSDRQPWLNRLEQILRRLVDEGESAVLACSALKESYRRQLTVDAKQVRLVFLHASHETLMFRLTQRRGHFLGPRMLPSQLADLEIPKNALRVDTEVPVDAVASEIRVRLQL